MKNLLFVLLALTAQAAFAQYDGPPPAAGGSSSPDQIYDGPPPVDTHDKYVAMAAGRTTFTWSEGQAVNVGGGAEELPSTARQTALRKCHSDLFPELESTCKVVFETHHGCVFAVKGTNPWGGANYGIGVTPQEAYDSCRTKVVDCEPHAYGGCSSPALKKNWPELQTVPLSKTVFVLTVGVVRYPRGGGTISVSGSAGRTWSEAEKYGVIGCEAGETDTEKYPCHVAYRFEHGCGYIADGWDKHNGAHWAFGTTKEEAKDKCDATGADCPLDKVRGGCVQGE